MISVGSPIANGAARDIASRLGTAQQLPLRRTEAGASSIWQDTPITLATTGKARTQVGNFSDAIKDIQLSSRSDEPQNETRLLKELKAASIVCELSLI